MKLVGTKALIPLALVVPTTVFCQSEYDIAFKYTDWYEKVWTDEGSGANAEVSFWRAKNFDSNYCALGDVVVKGRSKPSQKSLLVTSPSGRGLKRATGSQKVWTDAGSGANQDLSSYHLTAPSGYTCLGDVVTNGQKPQVDKYCCVRNDLLITGRFTHVWSDSGSGANQDFSTWVSERQHSDTVGIEANTFYGHNPYRRPSSNYAKLLNPNTKKIISVNRLDFTTKSKKPLQLFEESSMTNIWDDAGSGAKYDVSIWRVSQKPGYFSLGDLVVDYHDKPAKGFLLKVTDPDQQDNLVKAPVDYKKIWSDAGSGAKRDCSIWEVKCPSGFGSLGNVATGNASPPEHGKVWCVHSSVISYGSENNFRKIWDDTGSGARQDAAFYEQGSDYEQAVRGFVAIDSHSRKPYPVYVLDKSKVSYFHEKPITKIQLKHISYDLNNEVKVKAQKPLAVENNVMVNYDNRDQTMTQSVSYTKTNEKSFSFAKEVALGIEMEVKGGVPLVGQATTTVSATTTFSSETGKTSTDSKTSSISPGLICRGRHRCTVYITGNEYTTDIPYTATITKTYFDGSTATGTIKGTYHGVSVKGHTVTIGKQEPL